MKTGISVILPAYKEEENLKKLLPLIERTLQETELPHEILVVDTMEPTDNTKIVCEQNKSTYVKREGGNLYGDAIRTGMQKAQYEYTVVMDADGSHNPEDIKRFLPEIQNCDLVIGSRYTKGGKTDNNFILRAMSYILNCTYRIVFGIKAKDISDSFRMYKTQMLKDLILECQNFDIVEEILIKLVLHNKGLKIKEVPIVFNKREYGQSKRDLKKFIVSYLKTMKTLYGIKLAEKYGENSLFIRIIKFALTGGVGTLINLLMFFLLVDCLKINSTVGSCLAFLVAVTHNYFANHLWTFKSQTDKRPSIALWSKYVLSNLVGLACNLLVLNILVRFYVWKFESVPQLIGILVGMIFNFLLSNFFVFRKCK